MRPRRLRVTGATAILRRVQARIAATRGEVRSLVLLTAAAAVACAFSAAFPIAPGRPIALLVAMSIVGLVVCAGLVLAGPRVTDGVLVATVCLVIVIASILVGAASTGGGAMLTAYAYVWIIVYSALLLPRRATMLHAALITVGFGAGLLASGLPEMGTAWVLVSATAWVSGRALSGLAERVRHHAETDLVTGLLNRRAFCVAAEREHELAARTGADLSLVLIDLDDFKRVNDEAGHAAGDRLLADLAVAWHGVLRPADVLGRHGGDEFAVLLPATNEEGAQRVVGRLHDAHAMTWSSGVASWTPDLTLDRALARADARLYEAKRAKPRRGDGEGGPGYVLADGSPTR
jgi:diguanylate cyclase (GGDEF)-like protein